LAAAIAKQMQRLAEVSETIAEAARKQQRVAAGAPKKTPAVAAAVIEQAGRTTVSLSRAGLSGSSGVAAQASNTVVRASAAAPTSVKETRVKAWLENSRNQHTRQAYASGWAGFERYMQRCAVTVATVTAMDVADYLIERVEVQGVAASTVSGDRSAIADKLRHTHKQAIMEEPIISDVMTQLKNKATQSKPKLHMSKELMKDIINAHDARAREGGEGVSWLEERNIFLMLLMMMAFLREGEAVALRVEDIEVKSVTVRGVVTRTLQVYIIKSKTDQARNGAVVVLGEGRAEAAYCPVARYEKYMARRAAAAEAWRKEAEDRVADAVTDTDAFFPTKKGATMSSSTPCGIVQGAVRQANERARLSGRGAAVWGDADDYGSHSMRRGGVTAARQNGQSMLDIQRHGRWKSLTVFSYVGQSAEEQLAVTHSFLADTEKNGQGGAAAPVPAAAEQSAAADEVAGREQQEGKAQQRNVVKVKKKDDVPSSQGSYLVSAGKKSKDKSKEKMQLQQVSLSQPAPRLQLVRRVSREKKGKRKRQSSDDEEEESEERKEADDMEDALFEQQLHQEEEPPKKQARRRRSARRPAGAGGDEVEAAAGGDSEE
jgi:site-specific recombinase XerD